MSIQFDYIKKGSFFREVGNAPKSIMKHEKRNQYYLTLISDSKILSDEQFCHK